MDVIGALGLALALIGLYGTLLYTVKWWIPEIGIRTALGASRPAILRSGFWLVASGVTVGILLSVAAARRPSFLMSGITTYNPVTVAITSTLLFITVLGAIYLAFATRRANGPDGSAQIRTSHVVSTV